MRLHTLADEYALDAAVQNLADDEVISEWERHIMYSSHRFLRLVQHYVAAGGELTAVQVVLIEVSRMRHDFPRLWRAECWGPS